jgi:hypothetical protein
MKLLSPQPFPQPFPPPKKPLLPLQQHNKMIIKKIDPHPLSTELQFVAAKSLILVPPNINYNVSYVA